MPTVNANFDSPHMFSSHNSTHLGRQVKSVYKTRILHRANIWYTETESNDNRHDQEFDM